MIFKNKKGAEIQIVLLVLLTLVIVGFTLYTFITKTNKISTSIVQPRFLEQAQVEEGKARLYLEERASSAFKETKLAIEKEQDKSNERFKNKFREILKGKFAMFNPTESSLANLQNLIVNDNFSVEYDGKNLQVEVQGLEIAIKDREDKMLLVSRPEIKISIST